MFCLKGRTESARAKGWQSINTTFQACQEDDVWETADYKRTNACAFQQCRRWLNMLNGTVVTEGRKYNYHLRLSRALDVLPKVQCTEQTTLNHSFTNITATPTQGTPIMTTPTEVTTWGPPSTTTTTENTTMGTPFDMTVSQIIAQT